LYTLLRIGMSKTQSEIVRHKSILPPPRLDTVRKATSEWQVYRTRFLIRARQLAEPLSFVDALGREHQGDRGDYLVESSDGTSRIAPRHIFEDIYVAMGPAGDEWPAAPAAPKQETPRRRSDATRAVFA
jgi:hypothetical protein